MRLAQGLPGHPLLPSHRSGLKAARRSRGRPLAPQRAGPLAARLGPRPVPRPGPGPAPPLTGSFPPLPQTSCSRGHPPWGRGSVTHLLALPTLWVVLRLGASLWLEPLSSAFSSLNTPPGRLSAPPPRVPAPLGSLSPHTPDTALRTEADSCSLPIRPVTTRGQGALSQSHHGAAGPGCERRSARSTAGGADGETEAPRGKQGPDKLGLVTPAPHPAWTLEHRAGLGEAGGIRLQPPSRLHEGQKPLPGGRWVSLDPAPCTVQLPGWAGMWGGHLGYSRHLERAAASWEGAPSTWKPEDVGAPPAHRCPLLWESASTPLLADCRAGAPRVGDLLLGESWGLSELGSGIPRACTLPASPGKLWSACSCPAPGWAAPCLPVPAGTAPGGSQAAGR